MAKPVWLTNALVKDVDKIIAEFSEGWEGRIILSGDPKETTELSVSDLINQGVTGLYEIYPGKLRGEVKCPS